MSECIFYFDEFLKDDQVRNQVRLVKDDGKSGETVIIRGFTTSDQLNIDIRHAFNKLNGLDIITKLKNKIEQGRHYAAGGLSVLDNTLDYLANEFNGFDRSKAVDKEDKSFLGTDLQSFVNDKLRPALEKWGIDAQHHFDYADAYMYIFDGTDIEIPNQFKQILLTDEYNKDIEKEARKIMMSLVGEFKTYGGNFIGLTAPPNGFRSSLEGLKGMAPEGTFTMYIGDYRFPGIVITSMDIDISKTRVETKHGYKPLYVEISYNLKPVIKYTRNHLMEWFGGSKVQ